MTKQTILEHFGRAYQAERFPPLSGKIIGLFMITGKRHLSFEEIQEELNVSKGALSKNLNLLINLNRVTFITDEKSKRKRLFSIDIKGTKKHIYGIVENFEYQNSLLYEAKKMRKNGDEDVCEFIDDSIAFSEKMIMELKRLIPKYFK